MLVLNINFTLYRENKVKLYINARKNTYHIIDSILIKIRKSYQISLRHLLVYEIFIKT